MTGGRETSPASETRSGEPASGVGVALAAAAIATGLVWAWMDAAHGTGLAPERSLAGWTGRFGAVLVVVGGAGVWMRQARGAVVLLLVGAVLALLGGSIDCLAHGFVGVGPNASAYGPRRAGLAVELVARGVAPIICVILAIRALRRSPPPDRT